MFLGFFAWRLVAFQLVSILVRFEPLNLFALFHWRNLFFRSNLSDTCTTSLHFTLRKYLISLFVSISTLQY